MNTSYKKKIQHPIELIAFDFDGIFTNNQVLLLEDGTEGVFVNRSDGLAINQLRKSNYKMVIISTEKNKVVDIRAKKLNIPVFSGIDDKAKALSLFCYKKGFFTIMRTCSHEGHKFSRQNIPYLDTHKLFV